MRGKEQIQRRRSIPGLGLITLVLACLCACRPSSEPRSRHGHFDRAIPWNASPPIIQVASAPQEAQAACIMPPSPSGPDDSSSDSTLILFDSTGPYGHLGELYAIGSANLVSHFGTWTAKEVSRYTCGEAKSVAAVIYFGSTYDEPLPPCFLDDVLQTSRPVIWGGFNIWQLTARAGDDAFTTRHGWHWQGFDFSRVARVRYKGQTLSRYAENASGLMQVRISDANKARVLASTLRPDGTTFPWAVRSGNLTYISEIPFTYMSEGDRMLIFADLLFDALAPGTPERHRALLRLEDINPTSDPAALRAIADFLYAEGIPFGFGVVPEYLDPKGDYNDGIPESVSLASRPKLVSALQYLLSRGGVLVMHGRSHQWSGGINPYNMVSTDDTEFFRVTENADHSINFHGPLPEDSVSWARGRLEGGRALLGQVGLPPPQLFEFPHYSASVNSQLAVAQLFRAHWERALYFGGLLRGPPINHAHLFGQFFPYVVRDVYGSTVLPENLGNISPDSFYGYPTRMPADLILDARRSLVVRDGFASFYFHPFLDIELLKESVRGIRALGFTFVNPNSLIE